MLANDDKSSVLCEASGSKREEIAYSPYGYSAGGEGALGYNGERREAQVDYVLGNGYRTFSPLLMRFRSPDSWSPFGEGGLNAYMYVMGNPIEFADETGHAPGLLARIFRRIFGNKAKATTNVSPKFKVPPPSKKVQPEMKPRRPSNNHGRTLAGKGTDVKASQPAKDNVRKGKFWDDLHKNEGRTPSNLYNSDPYELLHSKRESPPPKLLDLSNPQSGLKRLQQTLANSNSYLNDHGQQLAATFSGGLRRDINSTNALGMVKKIRK